MLESSGLSVSSGTGFGVLLCWHLQVQDYMIRHTGNSGPEAHEAELDGSFRK